ncbi:MAG: CoA transferase [Candidatus Wallbacteria bacterium]|nr:CoA transferase [Candidatus Wallbacteria bacterium]
MPGPLASIRVLDFSRLVPGPYATQILADLGADVIKVEDPGAGDYLRAIAPLVGKQGAAYSYFNRGKRGIVLDLKTAAGREAGLALASRADVLVEGFRPGVMESLGLGWPQVRAVNPRVVYCSISGFGQTGPHARRAGHDLTYVALAGLLSLTRDADGSPVIPGVPIADLAGGGLWAVVAILAALRDAERMGLGQQLDVSMHAGVLAFLGFHGANALAGGNGAAPAESVFFGAHPAYAVYTCGDGRHVAVAALEAKFWSRLCSALGIGAPLDPLSLPKDQWTPMRDRLQRVFESRPRQEWVDLLGPLDCCVEPVLDLPEAFDHPQAATRGCAWEMLLPGGATVRQPAFPVGLSETPATPAGPPPEPGEHTEQVLAEAGLGAEEIARLRAAGAFGPV